MSDNVTRLHRPVPVPAPSADDLARRVALLHDIAPAVAAVKDADVASDADCLALLVACVGDAADAYRFGHADIGGEWRKVLVAAWAVVERDMRRRAR